MLENQVTLRTRTLVRLLHYAGSEPHPTLEKGATWYSREALQRIDADVHAELAGAGLAGDGGVHPDLLATVEAIAHPELEYYGWITAIVEGAPVNLTVFAGSGRGEGFTLVHNTDAGAVAVASVPAAQLLEAFLAQLPPWTTTSGRTIAVPKSAIEGRSNDTSNEDHFSVMRSETPSASERDVAEFKRLIGLERHGGGQLYVATRHRSGHRRRAERPVSYVDTDEGRWLVEETAGTGEPMLSAAPATSALLGSRLREAQSTLGA
ncbi:EspG family [Prauserella sp. Am3]|nr:EspG family [Prauserella sp. Am3]